MKILKIFTCLVLVASFLAAVAMPIGAARVTYYLSDLTLAEADTAEEAKSLLTEAGYTILDKNLNPGGGKVIYLGYKKSKNVDDAITDVRVMNMGGGFNITDYESIRQEAIAEYGSTVDRIRIAAKEFAENYQAGKREALLAYRQLNYYYVENNGVKTKMGDYMLSFPEKNEDFADILLKGNPTILDNIRNLLAMGVSDGGALIERIEAAVNDESVYGKKEYWEDAKVLADKIVQLKKLLNETKDRIEDIMSDRDMTEEEREMSLVFPRYTYTLLTAFDGVMGMIPFKGGDNYSEHFDKNTVTDYAVLYPFIEAMTPGQRAMAVSGQLHSVLVYNSVEMSDEEIEAKLAETEEGFEELSVYLGTDMALLEGAVGVTSDALREEAATGNSWFACFTGNKIYDIVISALFGAGGGTIVGVSAHYLNTQIDGGYFSDVDLDKTLVFEDEGVEVLDYGADSSYVSSVHEDAQSVSSVSSSSSSSGGSALGIGLSIFGLAVGIAMMVFSIYSIIQIANKYKVEYTEIPAYMVDVVSTVNGNRYVNYSVVNAMYANGDKTDVKPGDTNAYDGERWNAIYYTKSYEAGKCMTANAYVMDNASDFGKYTPVAMFGSNLCYDLNAYNGSESKEAVYLAFGNSNNKKTAETSVPTVVGSVFAYSAIAVSGVAGIGIGMGLMAFLKRKKEKAV